MSWPINAAKSPPQRFTLRRQHLYLLRSSWWVLLVLFVFLPYKELIGSAFPHWPFAVLLVGSIFWLYYRKRVGFQQELATPKIQQGTGQLVYGRKGYQIQLSNCRFSLDNNSGGLLPGVTYRIYYLPKSAFVLSASKVEDADESQVKEGLLNILAQAIGFSMKALAANRQGRLKMSQYLYKPKRDDFLMFSQGMFIFSLIVSLMANLGQMAPGSNDGLLSLAALTASLFLVCQLLFWFLPLIIEMTGGLHHFGRVESVEGVVTAQAEPVGTRATAYRYQINGEVYKVTRDAYDALLDGLRYRIYYMPHSKKLVSIEPLESPKGVTNGGVVIADYSSPKSVVNG